MLKKIQRSMEKLSSIGPIDPTTFEKLSEEHLLWIELFLSRFGKLQDFLGTKVMDAFLETQEENIRGLSMLDKIHRLERLGIIDHAQLWKEMREARNHCTHEYPNHPEWTAHHLNTILRLAPVLLDILERIKTKVGMR